MITTLALLVAGLGPAVPILSCGTPVDVVEDVLRQAESDWAGIKDVTLSANAFRDKRRLCAKLDALMGESKAARGPAAAEALLEGLGQDAPAGLQWRTHELRSRLLESNPAAAYEALTRAIEAYPESEYTSPMKHSFFQHLVNARAPFAIDAKGGEAAAKEILGLLRGDARYSYFYADPLQGAFLAKGEAASLEALFDGAAEILAERDPAAARDLRSRSIPKVLRLDDNPKKLYVLIGGDRPGAKDRPLVVVMPGGSGQALDFLPWMLRITEPLLDDYCFAVLSAPVWSDRQKDQVVWTTERHKKKFKAKFTVEDFARGVVKAHAPGDAGAYLFAWSSGGPAAYATILDRDPSFRGAYVLASVFKPDQLDVRRAKGKRFVLEQGRSDDVTPLRFAEEANEMLTKRGAEVKYVPFDGGHGFAMADAKASLAEALRWLSAPAESSKRAGKAPRRR